MEIAVGGYGTSVAASEGCMDILIGTAAEEVLIPNLLIGYAGQVVAGQPGYKNWAFPLYVPAGSRISAQAAGVRTSTAFRLMMWLYGGDGVPDFRIGQKVVTYGVTVPNGTAITPGASQVEGSWTQVVASTSEDHFALVPSFQPENDTTINNRTFALDLGAGAVTEELLGDGYWYETGSSESMCGPVSAMPVFADIPSGTRLVARASNNGVNDAGYGVAIHAVS
jgi:hypothetical protein